MVDYLKFTKFFLVYLTSQFELKNNFINQNNFGNLNVGVFDSCLTDF